MVPVVAFMKVSSQCCCLDGVSGSAFMFAGFGGGQVFERKVGRGAEPVNWVLPGLLVTGWGWDRFRGWAG